MSDDLAYQLTKVLFDKQKDLAAIHPEAKKLNIDTPRRGHRRRFIPAQSGTTRSAVCGSS
jgi:TRAP-type uncharacterized transport system substrate-binding protein